jgi:hypothetical protein
MRDIFTNAQFMLIHLYVDIVLSRNIIYRGRIGKEIILAYFIVNIFAWLRGE